MAQKKQTTFFWSPHDLLTYNRIFNFIIGNRGAGKTYAFKKWCIDDFLKKGNEFVYVRRYKTEMKRISQFFADIADKYPEHKLTVKGNTAFCDGTPFGYFIPLSVSAQNKSTAYPQVNKIIFDEFVIDKGSLHYLSNEVETFLELFETVARTRDNVRAFFLANSVTTVNPYFTYFSTFPSAGLRFTLYPSIVIETVMNEEFKESKHASKFGQLIAGTNYARYAIDNESLRDNPAFIASRPPNLRFCCTLIYKDKKLGVWTDADKGALYVDRKIDPDGILKFAVTCEDGSPNMLLLRGKRSSPCLNLLKEMFGCGCVYYDTIETKMNFYEIMGLFAMR